MVDNQHKININESIISGMARSFNQQVNLRTLSEAQRTQAIESIDLVVIVANMTARWGQLY